MDMSSVEHDRIFNPYEVDAQVKMCYNDKWKDRTPSQQRHRTDARIDMSDSM